MPDAPPQIVRTLALDDEIAVAEPILSKSERLDDATLIEGAATKSQEHLLAIRQTATGDGSEGDPVLPPARADGRARIQREGADASAVRPRAETRTGRMIPAHMTTSAAGWRRPNLPIDTLNVET
jgi:hypothetical protein